MRRTKIVATIGPVSDSEEMIERMIEAGVNVFRFNTKHGNVEWHSERMERVERVCERIGKRVAILLDLQGPEVRIDGVPESLREIKEDQELWFKAADAEDVEGIVLDHPEVFSLIEQGSTLYADDGFLGFEVIEAGEDRAKVRVIEGGMVKDRKTVNFPGTHLDFPTLVERDLEKLPLTVRHHVDFVALSFVRTPEDVRVLRSELNKLEVDCNIVSKIEHPDAVEQFDEILAESDGIMVARGDLGVEYSIEEVPGLQRLMVQRCREEGVPVIVATQMLESMIVHSRPTRAEVSDVAHAVHEGTDAVMLSAESAAGHYPVRAVKMMAKIAEAAEKQRLTEMVDVDWKSGGQTAAIVGAANKLMEYGFKGVCDLKAFVVLTDTGKTARYLARLRPNLPVYAMTNNEKTLDQLLLSWGIQPVSLDYSKDDATDVQKVVEEVKKHQAFAEGEKVVMIYGERWGTPGLTSVIRIQEVV